MDERSLDDHGYQSVRPYLFSVAYRMTGSASDAEDLVQDAWIRYLDAGSPAVDSLRAWMTTTVSRLALDYLKSARVAREAYVGPWLPEPVPTADVVGDPQASAETRESISLAFLTVMEGLSPDQRVVFVLREGLGLPFDEIARHIDKTATTCRQIFRRAQGRLAGEPRSRSAANNHRRLLDAFAAAIATGNAAAVTSLLHADATWIGDGGPDRLASRRPIVGADRVARGLTGFWSKDMRTGEMVASVADVNGAPVLTMYREGTLDQIVAIDVADDHITTIRVLRNLDKLAYLDHVLKTSRNG